ncbi:MAG: hypothetical protein ACK5YO_05845, partial [Planctomyces sp.]
MWLVLPADEPCARISPVDSLGGSGCPGFLLLVSVLWPTIRVPSLHIGICVGEMTMKNMFRSFLRSEEGFVLSTEAVLVGTILVLGMIVGLAEIRNAVVQELADYSQAVAQLSQDFAYTSVTSTNVNTNIQTSGSQFSDSTDIQRANGTVANGIG